MLKSIQNLSENKRKIILWLLMFLAFAGAGVLFVKNFQNKIGNFGKEGLGKGINLPNLQEELNKLPLPELKVPIAATTQEFTTTTATTTE